MAYADALDEAERGGELVVLLLCLFLVPLLGLLVASGSSDGRTMMSLAYVALGLGGLLVGLIYSSSAIAGTDRARMSLVFGPLIRIVMILLAASVLLQGGLLIYSVFTLEAAAFQRVHGGILAAVGLGAIAVCWLLLRSALGLFRSQAAAIRAVSVTAEEAPQLFETMNRLADKLGAKRPDHVVVGLEPNFFVTAAPVQLIGADKTLRGETLFVSLSLMRLFSKEELNAVIGHELGHFRGDYVAYSVKFAPTYTRLTRALNGLAYSTGGAADLGQVPAKVALSLCLTRFATAERTVGRHRELVADAAGATVASANALASALLKVALFAPTWGQLTEWHAAELNEGRTFTRLSETYRDTCQLNESLQWDDVLGHLSAVVQSHPVDTHPPLVERLEALGISLWSLQPEHCRADQDPAASLLSDPIGIDESLSNLEAQWLLAIGAARLPANHEPE